MTDGEARKNSVDALDRVARIEAVLNDYRGLGGYTAPGLVQRVRDLEAIVKLLIPVGYEIVDIPARVARKELRKINA